MSNLPLDPDAPAPTGRSPDAPPRAPAGSLDREALLSRVEALRSRVRRVEEERDALRRRVETGSSFDTDRYRSLFDAIDQGFCIVRVLFDEEDRPVDFRYLEINDSFEAQTGLRDPVGETMRSLRPGHKEGWCEVFGGVARTGEPVRFEERAEALGRWYDVYAFRVGEPEERRVAILFDDVSARKKAEAARARLETELAAELAAMRRLHELSTRLVEAADLADILDEILGATITLQDADFGNVKLYDPESGSLSITAQRGFSESFLDDFRAVGSAEGSASGRALRRGERVVVEDVLADPGYRPHRRIAARAGYRAVQSTPILRRDGTVAGALSTHFREPHRPSDRDLWLTDLYLRIASEVIEWEWHERSLRAAKRAAERESEVKSRLLSTINHELRNPLQIVTSLLDLLKSGNRERMGQEQLEYLSRVDVTVDHIIDILDQILTFSRTAEETVTWAEADVVGIARSVVQMFEGEARAADLALRSRLGDDRVLAVTDEGKVRQVLINLVGNAIAYTESGAVEVELEADEEAVALRVRDTGPGIPVERQDTVFEPFTRGDDADTGDRAGSGLGLAISRRLARRLGGDLGLDSAPGAGSVFEFRLPRRRGGDAGEPRPDDRPTDDP